MDFEFIYQAYFKDVFLYVRSLSADEHIAEEITQETFTKALKSLSSFDGKKDVRAWLFTIAKNTFYTYCKRQKIFSQHELHEEIFDLQPDLIEKFADEETAFRIHQYLHQMKDPYKEVFTLRVFGELSFEKIAVIFGKSSSWARVVFYRAKVQIKEYMEVSNNE
jgi:RNA polymerase sigma factor (sigma-70 family)